MHMTYLGFQYINQTYPTSPILKPSKMPKNESVAQSPWHLEIRPRLEICCFLLGQQYGKDGWTRNCVPKKNILFTVIYIDIYISNIRNIHYLFMVFVEIRKKHQANLTSDLGQPEIKLENSWKLATPNSPMFHRPHIDHTKLIGLSWGWCPLLGP